MLHIAVATSVKMQESDKARLDRLQARLTGLLGRRITQEVLLARLLALGETEIDRLAAPGSAEPEEGAAKLSALPVRTGIRTREEEIDRALYGAPA